MFHSSWPDRVQGGAERVYSLQGTSEPLAAREDWRARFIKRAGLSLISRSNQVGYRRALRWSASPLHRTHALIQLIYLGDEFQNAITARHDGTSDVNVTDYLRDCRLMLVVSEQTFESLISPETIRALNNGEV